MAIPAEARSRAFASDIELAARIGAGDERAFETLMRRHNTRLFRVARSILKDDGEAEDAVQEAYLQAYRRISEFRGTAQLATWLTRIVINQALMQVRRSRRRQVVPFAPPAAGERETEGEVADVRAESPSAAVLRAELRRLLEQEIDRLPLAFRTVFVLREIEQLTVEETAECLSIPAATVRTRLFRARGLLREALERELDAASVEAFGFAGDRCDRIVSRVLAHVRQRGRGLRFGNAGV